MISNRYYRKSTSITVSTFYEQYQLKKYNLDPPYQRDMNVWDINQKSFLMDTIFKNFPTPPIFLEQKINSETGITNYDVIDGKQRLSTIIGFINNEVPLPKQFGSDIYGYDKLNGLYFDQIKSLAKEDETAKSYVAEFWAYSISIEYIENPDYKIVDSIFDRLNREGSRLNPQELRKAQYYDTFIYNDIISFRNDKYIMHNMTAKLNKNRMEDVGFITELYIMTAKNDVFDGNENEIDKIFADMVDNYDEKEIEDIKKRFTKVKNLLEKWNINYSQYNIQGVSHLYALWFIALTVVNRNLEDEEIHRKMIEFYSDLRKDRMIPQTTIYQQSMQSASRSKSSRRKRIDSILSYLELNICK